MPHTFQVGDRVIIGDATQCDYRVSRCGESGVLKSAYEFGYEVALDKQELNSSEGIWYVSYGDLRHEIVLRKGDWVRYEKVDEVGTEEWNGKVGVVTFVDDDGELHPAANVKGIANRLLQANLVKIQPPVIFNDCYVHEPQEEPMQERQEDAIELGIQEKIRLLERQVEKAKCCLETYRDIKRFINKEDHHGTR